MALNLPNLEAEVVAEGAANPDAAIFSKAFRYARVERSLPRTPIAKVQASAAPTPRTKPEAPPELTEREREVMQRQTALRHGLGRFPKPQEYADDLREHGFLDEAAAWEAVAAEQRPRLRVAGRGGEPPSEAASA